MSERDLLYNEILKTVKEHGQGMKIGCVIAVLAEVSGEITRRMDHETLSVICGKLNERTLRT